MAGTKWQHSTTKGKVGVITLMDSSQSSNQNSLTWANLRHWLVNHDVHRREIDGQSTKSFLDLYKQHNYRSSEKESNMNYQNRDS